MNDGITTCKIEGCERTKWARGWCRTHYARWYKHGDTSANLMPDRVYGTPEERFWPKVDASGDCWEWTGAKGKNGYGVFSVPGRNVRAHRFAWETLVGPIGEELVIDHLCKNRGCVNPDHLDTVTPKENYLRGANPCAVNARKTHCKRNHEFTPENTYIDPNGYRQCRSCNRERNTEGRRINRK